MKAESVENDKGLFPISRMIYTDGSGNKSAIGAAAVAFVNSTKMAELHYQLGPDTRNTVLKGELVAIILGLHLSHNIMGSCDRINLNINNQATIKTMGKNCMQSAQFLIDRIKCDIGKIHEEEKVKRIRQNAANQPEMEITFTWIASHKGSTGNEAVDKQAKQAAEFGLSSNDLHYLLFFAGSYQHQQKIIKLWELWRAPEYSRALQSSQSLNFFADEIACWPSNNKLTMI